MSSVFSGCKTFRLEGNILPRQEADVDQEHIDQNRNAFVMLAQIEGQGHRSALALDARLRGNKDFIRLIEI